MNKVENAVTVAVLAGGASRRMGADKSLAELEGKPLIQHVLACVRILNAPVLLVTDKPEQYRQFQIEVVSDILPGKGSLGGIYSALMSSSTPFTLCVACDMPFLNVTLLTYLLSLRIGFDAVVPMINNQPQGLHAIYHRRAAAPIRDSLNRNELRISSVFDKLRVRLVGEAAIRAIDPELRSFTNLNTPEELARLRREFEQNAPSDTD